MLLSHLVAEKVNLGADDIVWRMGCVMELLISAYDAEEKGCWWYSVMVFKADPVTYEVCASCRLNSFGNDAVGAKMTF